MARAAREPDGLERLVRYVARPPLSQELADAGFTLERWFLRPPGKLEREQPWLAIVWRKHADSA